MEAIFLTSELDGRIYAANPAACSLLRRTEAEIIRLGRDGVVDMSSPNVSVFLDARARLGEARGELFQIRSDGTRVLTEVASKRFADVDGTQHTVITAVDLTERARRDEALAKYRQLLEAIIDSTRDLIFSVDAERFELTLSNRAFSDLIARHKTGAVSPGMGLDELMPTPEDAELWHGYFRRAIAEGPFTIERVLSTEPSIFEFTFNPLVRDGVATGVSVFGKDVTAQRKSQRQLLEQKADERSLFAAMAEGMAVHSAEGAISALNPAAERILGRSSAEIIGLRSEDPSWEAIHEDGSPFPGVEHPAMVTLRTGEPLANVSMGIRMPTGERHWISINSEPVYHPDTDGIYAAVTTFHDVTDLKAAAERIAVYVRQLEDTMRHTLQAVAKMVEARDPYTAGHEDRVGRISADIARELGWPEDQCRSLQLIGSVHDIGKIGVPAEILSKPGRLSELELSIVRMHSAKGYEILKDVAFPLPVAEIIYQHHERIDGSGYPRGLKDGDILLEARVLAVADVIEAMASHRPYRPALGLAAALEELEKLRGTRFDPAVVDALVHMVRDCGYRIPEQAGSANTP
jgi:PAS domain S-box-containing protein